MKVMVIPRGCGSLGEIVAGLRELLGFFQVVQVTQVWVGAVWMEAPHPPGWIREDGLDQLSISFGFLSWSVAGSEVRVSNRKRGLKVTVLSGSVLGFWQGFLWDGWTSASWIWRGQLLKSIFQAGRAQE